MVLEGKDIVGYEKMNDQQREILKIFVNNIDPVPDIIALGSSRVMQLSREVLHIDSFFNCSVTGGDRADVMGRSTLRPRGSSAADVYHRVRSVAAALRRHRQTHGQGAVCRISGKMSEHTFRCGVVETDSEEKWQALYSPEYFQNNLSYAAAIRPAPTSLRLSRGMCMRRRRKSSAATEACCTM